MRACIWCPMQGVLVLPVQGVLVLAVGMAAPPCRLLGWAAGSDHVLCKQLQGWTTTVDCTVRLRCMQGITICDAWSSVKSSMLSS